MKCKLIMFFCIYFFTLNTIQSQIKSGKITYERKTNLYKKFKNNGDVKEWLKEDDKNKLDVFELYFNDSLSVFKPQESDLVGITRELCIGSTPLHGIICHLISHGRK